MPRLILTRQPACFAVSSRSGNVYHHPRGAAARQDKANEDRPYIGFYFFVKAQAMRRLFHTLFRFLGNSSLMGQRSYVSSNGRKPQNHPTGCLDMNAERIDPS